MTEPELWYVGRTRFGQELKVRNKLSCFGITHFIPIKHKVVERCGKKKTVDAPAINNLVFIKTTKTIACSLANYNDVPVKYIVDRSTRSLMVIPMKQMENFIRVFNEDDGGVSENCEIILTKGDKVRVCRGPLAGVEGEVLIADGRTFITVTLGCLAQAKAEIAPGFLEKL